MRHQNACYNNYNIMSDRRAFYLIFYSIYSQPTGDSSAERLSERR